MTDWHTRTVDGAEAFERGRWFAEAMRHGEDRPDPRDFIDEYEGEDDDDE